MRFKIDENLPADVAVLLRQSGHDASTVFEQQMVGEPDQHIASVCNDEQRILVTLDLNFSDLRTYPPADHCGIIVLRPHVESKPAVLSLMNSVVSLLHAEQLEGRLWIVQESGVRIRGD